MVKRRLKAVDALRIAIEREREASKFYLDAIAVVTDPSGIMMLNWLVREESRHLAKLSQQLNSLLENNRWIDWKRDLDPIDRAALQPRSEATGDVGVNAAEQDILRQAIEAEKAAYSFYMDAEQQTPDLGGKSMFRILAEEEEGHLILLEEELEWIIKYGRYFTLHRFGP